MRRQGRPWNGLGRSVELSAGFAKFSTPAMSLLAAAVAQLQDELAVVFVDPLAETPPEWDSLVAIDVRIVGQDASADADRDVRRDDGADPASGELRLPIDAGLRP